MTPPDMAHMYSGDSRLVRLVFWMPPATGLAAGCDLTVMGGSASVQDESPEVHALQKACNASLKMCVSLHSAMLSHAVGKDTSLAQNTPCAAHLLRQLRLSGVLASVATTSSA